MGRKVLVADDDQSVRQLIVRLLDGLGVEDPAQAADGDEAVALFEQGFFDLVITDWEMPGKTGLEILRDVRATNRRIPIIMVTAESRVDRVKEAIDAGVTDYVVKPFDHETLKEKLKAILQSTTVNTSIYRCRNVMNPEVVSISQNANVAEAIARLLENDVSGLPVLDRHDNLVGIISEYQAMRVVANPDMKQQPVHEVMSRDVVTVREDTIPLEVVNLMERHRIRRIPVVRNRRVVGIIARRDILRYVTEHEDALREFLDTLRATAAG